MMKRHGKIEAICKICGRKFYVWNCQIKRGEGKYCSTECQGIAHAKFMTGRAMSPEAIEKTRQKNLGRRMSEVTKLKISEALKQHIRTKEHSQKISKALMGRETKPAIERFMDKVEKTADGCWDWKGSIAPGGYGKFTVEKNLVRKCFNAHRWAYEYFIGKIPAGLTLDHLCRNRKCVNPSHLEPVTIRENLLRGKGASAVNARKTHCPKGHPLVHSPFPSHQVGQRRYCPVCSKERIR